MLADQINQDYIQAMKKRDSLTSSVLSFLRAQLKNVMIDKKVDQLDDAETIGILKKQIKQRQDSIEQFTKGGRPELAEKEKNELGILKAYLPEELPEEKVSEIVDEAIAETGAQGVKDMGNVMKTVLARVSGQADSKLVSVIVRKKLAER